jgi:UDP-N-acetylmuramoyl-tripeptide--D-alanyl-D-alanine ligase
MLNFLTKLFKKAARSKPDQGSNVVGIIGDTFSQVARGSLKAIYEPKMEVLEQPAKGLFSKKVNGLRLVNLNDEENLKVLLNNLIITKIHATKKNEDLKSLEEVLSHLDSQNTVISNWNDNLARKAMEKSEVQAFFYGNNSDHCHVWSSNFRINNFQSFFELNYGVERVEIRTPLLGEEQVSSMLAAAAIALNDGFSLMEIKKGLEKLSPLEHVLEPLLGYNHSYVLDDTDTVDPETIISSIDLLNYLPARRRIVVLGQVELADKKKYQNIAQKIFRDKIDLVFLTMGDAKIIKDELLELGFIEDRIEFNLQIPQIVSTLLKMMSKGDVVLIEGSSKLKMNEIVRRISQK